MKELREHEASGTESKQVEISFQCGEDVPIKRMVRVSSTITYHDFNEWVMKRFSVPPQDRLEYYNSESGAEIIPSGTILSSCDGVVANRVIQKASKNPISRPVRLAQGSHMALFWSDYFVPWGPHVLVLLTLVALAPKDNENKQYLVGLFDAALEMAGLADLSIKVPSTETPRIQESHILIGHVVCAIVENSLFGTRLSTA